MDFIDDFIQEYKNNPCLWKADSANYKNRSKRQEAYMKLIEVAAKHGEHYNVERTKQKINNLRCAFRHQLKKYNELKNKGEKEEPYCPKRKYFESLMFLKDEESRDRRPKTDGGNEYTAPKISNNGNKSRLLSTETEYGTTDGADTERTLTGNGNCVDDTLQVPNNLFSDICKDMQKVGDANDPEDDTNAEEVSATNLTVLSEKSIGLSQDTDEVIIAPIRKEQIVIVESSPIINSTPLSYNKQQPYQQNTSKSRKRSSSFSSQHSNETTETATPVKAPKNDITLDIENLLSLACRSFQKSTYDHHTSFGEIVAYKLRSMDPKQSLYAEKIISDILYQGQMKNLSPATIEHYALWERMKHSEKK